MRRGVRRLLSTTAVLAVVAGAGSLAVLRPWQEAGSGTAAGSADGAASGTESAVTAPVELTTLTSQVRLNAQLTFGEPVEMVPVTGMITALPEAGAVIDVGHTLVEIDGKPVILLRGARPFWRELSVDSTRGPDVQQLEENLAALGYFEREPDTRFDWRTRAAVRDWQEDLGVERTGTLAPGAVVVVDAPSVRVAQLTALLGEKDASPLTYTAATLQAVAKLTPAQAREVVPGTPVTVLLPDGTELESAISAVDPGGQPTENEDETTPPMATIDFPDQSAVAAAGPVAVRLVLGGTEGATQSLVVPVTALIAEASGGYAVEVQRADGVIRVPVEIGLVADARVQVVASGPDVAGAAANAVPLAEGDLVVVAK